MAHTMYLKLFSCLCVCAIDARALLLECLFVCVCMSIDGGSEAKRKRKHMKYAFG